uniref:Uncharacterized protein n=1 Tax=Anguilla anguilla TaxID=7936 RepID=A0A0E9VEC1_ANGAN
MYLDSDTVLVCFGLCTPARWEYN